MKLDMAINGGLGDVIMLVGYWPTIPDRIFWMTRARPLAQPLLERVYPKIKHVNLWSSTQEKTRSSQNFTADFLVGKEDWSIARRFLMIRKGLLQEQPSIFFEQTLADVSRFKLPNRYVLCQHDTPVNSPNHREMRRLAPEDWDYVLARLEAEDRVAVVVDAKEADNPPDHPRVINLVGQTSCAESLELLKHSEGYWGMDGWLSLQAARLFPQSKLLIKLVNPHGKIWKDVYWAPHKEYPFLLEHFLPPKPKPGVFDAIDPLTPVQVLLEKPRLIGSQIHQRGSLVSIPAGTAKAWVKAGVAVCWQQRQATMATELDKVKAYIKAC